LGNSEKTVTIEDRKWGGPMARNCREKKRYTISATIAFMLLCTGAMAQSSPPIDPDIAETTFRYQFAHNASGQQADAHVYCIGFAATNGESPERRDPSPEFLSRFGDVTPPVKAYSQCSTSADKGVIDKATGKEGLIFTISSVKCADATRCEVEGGYYEASLSASGNTYYLERHDAKWVVVKDVMHWIA
jgi:hypothetical protein